MEDSGSYTVRVSDDNGSSSSDPAVLEVTDSQLNLSPWVLHESFEELALGDLNGQGGWSAQTHSLVVEDPAESGNQVYSFRPGGSNHSASKSLPELVEDGDSATFFFRFNIPSASSAFNQQIRFHHLDVFRIAFNEDHDSVFSIFYDGMGGGNDNVGIDQSIVRDTWYNVWVVLDGANSLYEIYINGGEHETPTRVTTADDVPEKYVYAERSNNTISTLTWIGWGGDAVLFDDVYFFHGGKRLDDPRLRGVTEGFSQWREENELEEGVTEQSPVPGLEGLTHGDLYVMGATRIGGEWQGLLHTQLQWIETGHPELSFHANPGREYLLQWTGDLSSGLWQDHGEELEGGGDTLAIRLPPPADQPERFYRLRVRVVD